MGDAMLHLSFLSATLHRQSRCAIKSSLRQYGLHVVQTDVDSERGIKGIPLQSPVSAWSKYVQVSQHTVVINDSVKGRHQCTAGTHEEQRASSGLPALKAKPKALARSSWEWITSDCGYWQQMFQLSEFHLLLFAVSYILCQRWYILCPLSLAIVLKTCFCLVLFLGFLGQMFFYWSEANFCSANLVPPFVKPLLCKHGLVYKLRSVRTHCWWSCFK